MSVACARWTSSLEVSRPDSVSLPSATVNATEVTLVKPPVSEIEWPLGAVESAAIVTVSAVNAPETLYPMTCTAPGALAPAVQL